MKPHQDKPSLGSPDSPTSAQKEILKMSKHDFRKMSGVAKAKLRGKCKARQYLDNETQAKFDYKIALQRMRKKCCSDREEPFSP